MDEHHRKADYLARGFGDQNDAGVFIAASVHLPEVCIRDIFTTPESRVDLPLGFLPLNDASATTRFIRRGVWSNCHR